MKLYKKIILVLLLVIVVFVANIFISTGYFRSIENTFDGEIVKSIPIVGAEDITIDQESGFAIISSTDRSGYPKISQENGGLYFINLNDLAFTPTLLTTSFEKPFAPHGISMLKIEDHYKIMAINHTEEGHFIEVFTLDDDGLQFEKTLQDPSMVSPNDIVMIDENRFYFTNDHKYTEGLGRILEDYGGLAMSNVIYFDGEDYQEVANGIAYANGINFDVERNLMFVASPRKFLIKVYKTELDGTLQFIENIDCGTGVDNIEFDMDGNLWVGAHPNLLKFAAYGKGSEAIAPSEILKIKYVGLKDYSVETIFLDTGTNMSASTVAAPYGDLILTGNVMDDKFLLLKYKP